MRNILDEEQKETCLQFHKHGAWHWKEWQHHTSPGSQGRGTRGGAVTDFNTKVKTKVETETEPRPTPRWNSRSNLRPTTRKGWGA